jgi:hypothetical protein
MKLSVDGHKIKAGGSSLCQPIASSIRERLYDGPSASQRNYKVVGYDIEGEHNREDVDEATQTEVDGSIYARASSSVLALNSSSRTA